MTSTRSAARALYAEASIDAPADRVWALLTDVSKMAEWSPELLRMVPLRPGGLRVGQWYLGLNRRRAVIWPTRSVVTALEPRRRLAWDTRSSGTRWIWEIATAPGGGTTVVHRREVPGDLTLLSKVFARLALGGSDGHTDELEAGMARTVARLRADAEA